MKFPSFEMVNTPSLITFAGVLLQINEELLFIINSPFRSIVSVKSLIAYWRKNNAPYAWSFPFTVSPVVVEKNITWEPNYI